MKKKTFIFFIAAMALQIALLANGLYLAEKSSEIAQEGINEYHLKMAQAILLTDSSDELPSAIEAQLMSAAYIGEDDRILTVKELIISSMADMELTLQEREQICSKFRERYDLSMEPEAITFEDNYNYVDFVELEYEVAPIKYHYRVYADGLVFKEVSQKFHGVEYSVKNKNNEILVKYDSRNYGPTITLYRMITVHKNRNKLLYLLVELYCKFVLDRNIPKLEPITSVDANGLASFTPRGANGLGHARMQYVS